MQNLQKPNILVTRETNDSEALAARLVSEGYDVTIAPMIRTEFIDFALPDEMPQAYLFTSRNAVHAIKDHLPQLNKSLPCFCVGSATKQQLEQCGFSNLQSTEIDARDLEALITQHIDHEKIWYFCGQHLSYDFPELNLTKIPCYETHLIKELDIQAKTALSAGKITHALFFSARTAENFCALMNCAGLENNVQQIQVLCISEKVCDVFRKYGYTNVHASEQPNQGSLLRIIK